MIARGALWNPSIFCPKKMVPVYTVMRQYLDVAKQCQNAVGNTKYCLNRMLGSRIKGCQSTLVSGCKTFEDLSHSLDQLFSVDILRQSYRPPEVLIERENMVQTSNSSLVHLRKEERDNISQLGKRTRMSLENE